MKLVFESRKVPVRRPPVTPQTIRRAIAILEQIDFREMDDKRQPVPLGVAVRKFDRICRRMQ